MEAEPDGRSEAGGCYVYETPWPSYALAWSMRSQPRCRLAVGSCVERGPRDEANYVQVLELNEESKRLELLAEVEHAYPPTKLMWWQHNSGEWTLGKPDLLASTSTTLNIWKFKDGELKLLTKLANSRSQQGKSGQLPPLTSFDWSAVNHHKMGVSSVDTTCTIWNLEQQKIDTQLIAHDKAVYDIVFSQSDNLFASVGADGSVRLFDQRNLDHSTIIYEASPPSPLLRLAWSKLNTHLIATVAMDTPGVILIDMRRPSVALAELSHSDNACVNHIAWAPHSRHHLLCGTDDGYALIWDVKDVPTKIDGGSADNPTRTRLGPALSYDCDHEVHQVHWPSSQPEYVALGMAKQVKVVQV
mmetsp:Transcript_120636/g.341096  ORF Transcript_120636/g.341096 Transcript_120636/m.341096 type:complete len:358 (-) Transcript_120636:132-1205(-)